MPTIPALALERHQKLRRMFDAARAAGDGLQPGVEHLRDQLHRQQIALELAARGHSGRVEVGPNNGLAYTAKLKSSTSPTGNDGSYATTLTSASERVPQFDGLAAAVHGAKRALAEATAGRNEALHRAQGIRMALEAAEAALRARGWRDVDASPTPPAGWSGGPHVVAGPR